MQAYYDKYREKAAYLGKEVRLFWEKLRKKGRPAPSLPTQPAGAEEVF
jgi:hypothetical protein